MAKILTKEEREKLFAAAAVNRVTLEKRLGAAIAKDLTEKAGEYKAAASVEFTIEELLGDRKAISYTNSVEVEKYLTKELKLKVKRLLAKVETKNGKMDTRVVGFVVDLK